MKQHHIAAWVIFSLILSACGGPTMTMPPPYEAPKAAKTTNQDTENAASASDQEESNIEEVVVPKVEPINPGNAKPYTVLGENYTPMKQIGSFMQTGLASWYGKKFHGRKTANGEIFNMYKLSAAHKTLPIPSYVQVTNERNQKTIIVRVNDRGPFVKNRIIDLSYAAAKKLDMLGHGTIAVTIQLVDPNNPETFKPLNKEQPNNEVASNTSNAEPVTSAKQAEHLTIAKIPATAITGIRGHFVQVGAFKSEQNADSLHQRVSQAFAEQSPKVNKVYNGQVFQIVLGPYDNAEAAKSASGQVRDQLQLSSMVFSQ